MKLYILGALAISGTEALLATGGIPSAAAVTALQAKYLYTLTGDCFTAGPATALGLNNIFYQYYEFPLTAGTRTITSSVAKFELAGCSHSHVYSFMGSPWVGTAAAQAGLMDSIAAYGYKMTGTTTTDCAVSDVVTTDTFYNATTKVFLASRYQGIEARVTPAIPATTTQDTTVRYVYSTLPTRGTGAGLYLKAFVGAAGDFDASPTATDQLDIVGTQNAYWDFLQMNVFMGATVFGRGGGAATGPCGWWVVYTYEAPHVGDLSSAADPGVATGYYGEIGNAAATVSMWTDNALTNALGASLAVILSLTY